MASSFGLELSVDEEQLITSSIETVHEAIPSVFDSQTMNDLSDLESLASDENLYCSPTSTDKAVKMNKASKTATRSKKSASAIHREEVEKWKATAIELEKELVRLRIKFGEQEGNSVSESIWKKRARREKMLHNQSAAENKRLRKRVAEKGEQLQLFQCNVRQKLEQVQAIVMANCPPMTSSFSTLPNHIMRSLLTTLDRSDSMASMVYKKLQVPPGVRNFTSQKQGDEAKFLELTEVFEVPYRFEDIASIYRHFLCQQRYQIEVSNGLRRNKCEMLESNTIGWELSLTSLDHPVSVVSRIALRMNTINSRCFGIFTASSGEYGEREKSGSWSPLSDRSWLFCEPSPEDPENKSYVRVFIQTTSTYLPFDEDRPLQLPVSTASSIFDEVYKNLVHRLCASTQHPERFLS